MTSAATIAYIQPPTRIDTTFVERAQALGHPERRFRFANACSESACPQWTGHGCAVADDAVTTSQDQPTTTATPTPLPACGIRHDCRWYAQHAAAACAVCPTIVADTG